MMKFQRSSSAGFGLVELAIGVLILGIIFAGIARLNIAGVRSKSTITRQANLNLVIKFIYERMRANQINGAAAHYIETNYTDNTSLTTDCAATTCTQAQRANYDLYQWKQQFPLAKSNIVGLVGVICRSSLSAIPTLANPNCSLASSNDPLVIKLAWESSEAPLVNYVVIKAPETISLKMNNQ